MRGAQAVSSATADECPDSEVRLLLDRAPANFGIDKDTSKPMFLVWF